MDLQNAFVPEVGVLCAGPTYVQLPSARLQAVGIYGHVFANGGSAVLVGGTGRDVRSTLQDFGSKFRWTVVSWSQYLCGQGIDCADMTASARSLRDRVVERRTDMLVDILCVCRPLLIACL